MVKYDGSLAELLAAVRRAAADEPDRTLAVHQLLALSADLISEADRLVDGEFPEAAPIPYKRPPAESMPVPHQQQIAARLYQGRLTRNDVFNDDLLFGEPAWNILLDLFASERVHRAVSIMSACIASRVPPTTALRWISVLVERGYIERTEDTEDGRRAFLTLTEKSRRLFLAYLLRMRRKSLL